MFFTLFSRRHFHWDLNSDQSEVCSASSAGFSSPAEKHERWWEETHRKFKTKTHFIHLIWNHWELKFVFVLWSDETESCSNLISDQLRTSSDSPTENRISGGRNRHWVCFWTMTSQTLMTHPARGGVYPLYFIYFMMDVKEEGAPRLL